MISSCGILTEFLDQEVKYKTPFFGHFDKLRQKVHFRIYGSIRHNPPNLKPKIQSYQTMSLAKSKKIHRNP